MIPTRNLYIIQLRFFIFFCLILSQTRASAQTSQQFPAIPLNPDIQTSPGGVLPPNPGTNRTTLDANGKPTGGSGKYEEYQSMCRENEYDTVKYYSAEIRSKRIALLKDKIAGAGTDSIKLKLRLLKEYIEQDLPRLYKPYIDELRKEKLSTLDINLLNSLSAYSIKNYSFVVTTLLKLLDGDKTNTEILLFLAETYSKIGNYYEASSIYEDLNKTSNKAYLIQLCESTVLNSLNAEGEKICTQAMNQHPENPFPLIFKGISHRERQEQKLTLSSFQKSVNIRPTEMGYVCLAETHFLKGNYTEAITQFKNALNVVSGSMRALLGLAWTHLKIKNYSESVAAFKKACAVNGKYSLDIRKAAKVLNTDRIPEAKLFVQAAEACGG